MDNSKDLTRNAPKGVTGFLKSNKKALISLSALLGALLIWFGIWEIASLCIGVSFILPSPIEAFMAFFKLLPQKSFILAVLGSIVRVIIGYGLGIAVGALAAFLGHFFVPLRYFFAPFMKVARATPVASFILICALWMNSNTTPVFISFLMVFPIVYENVLTGLNKTDTSLIEVTGMYGFTLAKKLTALYLPSAMPYLGSACISSLGLAWKSCVSAEVLIVTATSVGYYIYTSKLYFETEQLFAWTIAIVLLSVILEYAVKLIAHYTSKLLQRRYG